MAFVGGKRWCHNPYFSGNSFAIQEERKNKNISSHNPYFSGNSFAIALWLFMDLRPDKSQSLF